MGEGLLTRGGRLRGRISAVSLIYELSGRIHTRVVRWTRRRGCWVVDETTHADACQMNLYLNPRVNIGRMRMRTALGNLASQVLAASTTEPARRR
jgi:hypothetical protein